MQIISRSMPLVLALAVLGAESAVAHAQNPTSGERSTANADEVRVHVDFVTEVPEDQRGEFEAEFHERQFPEFASKHGLLEVGPDGEPELSLRLQIWQLEDAVGTYVLNSSALYHDKVSTEPERLCLQCTPADAVADALSNLARAAAAVVESRAELEPAPVEAPAPEQLDAAPAAPSRVRVLGPASYVGISTCALGLGAAIAGAVFLDRGKVLESEPGALTLEWTDHRPAGAALMGVGVGAMVVGTVLIGVDLGVLLPRRRERAHAQLEGISVTVERPGVLVTGRF
jgi:hypothetical protein